MYESSESDNDFINVKDSSLDNDETLKELGLINDQIVITDNTYKYDGFMTLDITQLKEQRKTSL